MDLLGPDGQPIARSLLTREEASPALTGLRHVFDEIVAPRLTPGRLAAALREATDGDMTDYLTLAEEMEERDPHYRAVLETRKNALTGLDMVVEAASDRPEDERIADELREHLVASDAFQRLPDMLSDALAKGFAAVEIGWETSASRWLPVSYTWRDPRLLTFDRATRSTLLLRALGEPEGRPLTPMKWLVHRPGLKMGLTSRAGLARTAMISFMLKSFTLRDWAEFLDIYGMPFRIGRYGPGASAEDRRVLLQAVRGIGRDAAAIIPREMMVEFVEAKGFSDRPFEGFARYLDAQLSKLIIGQTMTTDDGGSRAAAEVHDRVRLDIRRADARDLETTINGQLVAPWVRAHKGPAAAIPRVRLPIIIRKDLKLFADAVATLVDRGLVVEQAQVLDELGLAEAAPDAAVLRPAGRQAEPRAPARTRETAQAKAEGCPRCGGGLALASAEPEDERDRLVALAAAGYEADIGPIADAIQQEMDAAADLPDLLRRLDRLTPALPVEALARRIATLGMIGRGRGEEGIE